MLTLQQRAHGHIKQLGARIGMFGLVRVERGQGVIQLGFAYVYIVHKLVAAAEVIGEQRAARNGEAYLAALERHAVTSVVQHSQKITLPTVNANTIGQLMYFFELATAYAGELLGIDAFDQPGVEQSKIASYAVLGNKEEKYVKAAEEMSKQTLPFAEYVM